MSQLSFNLQILNVLQNWFRSISFLAYVFLVQIIALTYNEQMKELKLRTSELQTYQTMDIIREKSTRPWKLKRKINVKIVSSAYFCATI